MTWNLKRALLALGLLLLWCGPAASQQPAATVPPAGEKSAPAPLIVMEEIMHNAGEVDPATMVSHTFNFKNEGDAPLKIERVRTGCGCLVAEADKEVAPGASGKVTISIKVYREWAGQEINKTTWLFTNDPLNPQVRLLMSAQVKNFPQASDNN